MKHNKTITLYTVAVLLLAAAACTKPNTADFPNLSISSPLAGQMFHPGDTVYIRGNASASDADDAHLLHDVMVEAKWSSDSSTIFAAYFDTHEAESFDFDTFFITPPATSMFAFVVARAENHIPQVTSKSVSIMIHP